MCVCVWKRAQEGAKRIMVPHTSYVSDWDKGPLGFMQGCVFVYVWIVCLCVWPSLSLYTHSLSLDLFTVSPTHTCLYYSILASWFFHTKTLRHRYCKTALRLTGSIQIFSVCILLLWHEVFLKKPKKIDFFSELYGLFFLIWLNWKFSQYFFPPKLL